MGFKRFLLVFHHYHSSYPTGQGVNMAVIPTVSFPITHRKTEEMVTEYVLRPSRPNVS